ncbi:MAG: hypothetical protein ACO3PV_08630 [Pseudohongiellaceae bacterium]
MALSANTNVASTVANYFSDNYTALLQAGTAVPPSYTAPASTAFNDWKTANAGKQYYLEKSGDTFKLGSVSGNDALPDGAEAIELDVAYAIEAKELSLTDWVLARMMDEIRQSITVGSFSSALSSAPGASVNFDPSTMSQSDLEQLLKRLEQVRGDLQTAMAVSDASDKQSSAAKLGLASSQLGAALAQQALFQEEAATLPEAVAVSDAQRTLENEEGLLSGARLTLETATLNSDAARIASEADPDNEALTSAYETALQETQDAQTAVIDAEAAVAAAAATLSEAQSDLEAVDNFYEVVSEALAQLVASLTSEMQAAQLAFSQAVSSNASSTQLGGLVGAAGGALNSRLASAADLALLGNPALSLFSALDVQETDDGFVLDTANKSARETQRAAVRDALEEALSDPALQTALADAMAANADSLGTSEMELPSQMQLYNEVAAAVISAMRGNEAYLDELARGAVDFFAALDQSVGNDLLSASQRDSVLLSGMN